MDRLIQEKRSGPRGCFCVSPGYELDMCICKCAAGNRERERVGSAGVGVCVECSASGGVIQYVGTGVGRKDWMMVQQDWYKGWYETSEARSGTGLVEQDITEKKV